MFTCDKISCLLEILDIRENHYSNLKIISKFMIKTLPQIFNEFLYDCEFSRKLKPATLLGYRETFRLMMKLVPETNLNSINSVLIIAFFRTLEERKRIVGKGDIKMGVKNSTVATYRGKLNTFFNWLVTNRYIEVNPLNSMKAPSVIYSEKKYLSKNDIEKILTAIHTHHDNNLLILKRNLLLFYLLLFCGLRREELLRLQVRDFDLDKRHLTIRAENSKSQKTRRIPLHPEIIIRYKDYLNQRSEFATQFIFVSSNQDRNLSSGGLEHIVRKLIDATGIHFHVHQFRHTFAMNFLKQSNNIFKLKELLGHSDISMTTVYLRQLPTDEMRTDVESMTIDNLI